MIDFKKEMKLEILEERLEMIAAPEKCKKPEGEVSEKCKAKHDINIDVTVGKNTSNY